jgi:arylsulfatase A-like enzyme
LFKRRSGDLPKLPGDLSAEDWRFVHAAYDEEIAFVDAQLGRLRRGLEERGILERGIVALTADHGEELFDHGGFEHGHTLYEELVRVPLVFWGAGVRAGRETEPVSLVDVAPTLLEAAGLAPVGRVEGLSLWPNLSDTAAIPERTLHFHDVLYGSDRRGALRWPWKAIVSEGVEGVEYWNLEQDPHEQKPAAGRIPPPVARLLVEIGEQGSSGGLEAAVLDEGTLEELKALGYLD